MKKYILIIFCLFVFFPLFSFSQDSVSESKIKKGWNFGFLPVVSYNSDLGFQYGVLTNVYNYGDGSSYPKYKHSLYAEVSRYTKGSGIYRFFYDSEYLIPKIRFTADVLYLPDRALDFFGFNGYEAVYNSDLKDDKSEHYLTRMFYKHQRNIFRVKIDFQGQTGLKNLRWVAGYNFMKIDISPVDINHLNKGKDSVDMLPNVSNLYDKYVEWGVISQKEASGGIHNSLKLGLVYDTRDNEPCPMKGLWSEIVLFNSFGNGFNFGKLSITHRQYFTIVKNDLSFVYRIGYQGVVYGESPFYLLPYMVYSYMPSSSVDGLGGSKSVRGMLRNRTVGDGMAYANFEFRYKFVRFKFIKQNWYCALNPFFDAGMVVQPYKFDKSQIPDSEYAKYFAEGKEVPHLTYGCGLHISMNENFVISADFGFPIKKDDGKMGVYIAMNWLF